VQWHLYLSLICVVLAAGCSHKAAEDEEVRPAEVPTITAQVGSVVRKDMTQFLSVRGIITAVPNEDVKVSSLVPGRVTAVVVAEGDPVSAGQLVAEIDRQTLEDQRRQAMASVDQARAAFENARLNLERTQRLFERGIAAGKEVEDARAQLAAARAALEQTQAGLSTADRQVGRARVTSPIAGLVVKRLVSVGEQVDGTAAQPIVEIANLDRVELAANVPSEYLHAVRTGGQVPVSSDAYTDRSFDGQVIAIAPAVDPTTNAGLVRIRINNTGRLLKVGMYAQARIHLADHPRALTVPPAAVVRDQRGAAVYVVDRDTARRTSVTIGIENPDAIEILSGVSENQKILVSATYGLGDQVKLAHP
jgi:RND family efflux transporter MFP subunit